MVTYLFYSVLLKHCLVGNIQGKFQKNCLTTIISEESP